MNIEKLIKQRHQTIGAIPGRLYYIGAEVKENRAYLDTGNMHEISRFCWFAYHFTEDKHKLETAMLYAVMYDYMANTTQKAWFDKKCTDLFNLGFKWSDAAGIFYLEGVWSCYWEQVNNADDEGWRSYLAAVNEAIEFKNIKLLIGL